MGDKNASAIKDVLKTVIANISGDEEGPRLNKERINAAWGSAVGKKLAGHSRPTSLRKGRLIVNVSDSSMLYDLTLQKKNLLKKLEKKVESRKITQIQFRIGEV